MWAPVFADCDRTEGVCASGTAGLLDICVSRMHINFFLRDFLNIWKQTNFFWCICWTLSFVMELFFRKKENMIGFKTIDILNLSSF